MEPLSAAVDDLPIIFVTGGAGYIGSHFLDQWCRVGREQVGRFQLVVLDNLSGGHLQLLESVNREMRKNYLPDFILEVVDLCEFDALRKLFEKYRPRAVIHFAGKISVAESVENPDLYFKNNVGGSENLLAAMQEFDCQKIVFSSTAAVYGNVDTIDSITEDFSLDPLSPYGESKLRTEQAITEASAQWGLQAIIFRYFNAAGAALSGLIGEWHEPETHLIPLVLESLLRPGGEVKIFGQDYPTRDGTCIRDYIHVTDLAQAHILGLTRLLNGEAKGTEVYNLGTESGTSVLEVIEAVKSVTKKAIKVRYFDRRSGDAIFLIASPKKASRVLGWHPEHSAIETIIKTAFVWQQHLDQHKNKRP